METPPMRTMLICLVLALAPVALLPSASAMPEPECNSDYPTYEACEASKDLVACLLGDRPRCPT